MEECFQCQCSARPAGHRGIRTDCSQHNRRQVQQHCREGVRVRNFTASLIAHLLDTDAHVLSFMFQAQQRSDLACCIVPSQSNTANRYSTSCDKGIPCFRGTELVNACARSCMCLTDRTNRQRFIVTTSAQHARRHKRSAHTFILTQAYPCPPHSAAQYHG